MPLPIKPYLFLGSIVSILFSCTPKEELNSYIVQKQDFINQITVPGYLEAAQAQSITAPRIWSGLKIYAIIEEGTYVQAGDTVCILEASELENNYNSSVKDLEIAKAEYNRTREDLNLRYLMLESQVKTIETTTAIKRLDSAQQEFVSEIDRQIINLELEKAEIERQKINSNLKFLKQINESELKKTKLKIQQAENNVNRTKELLDKLIITSPNEGLVQLGKNWSTGKQIGEGDPVWGNMPLVNLPDLSKLQVRMVVSETSYKKIDTGQDVLITVDAHPELSFKGKVKRKAPAGKPIKKKSKVKTYDVFVSIDSADFNVTPGLSVTCNVILNRINDTIVVPLPAIYENDSTSFVLLKKGGEFEKQAVKIAAKSDIEAVIENGLIENDIVSINYSSKVK